MDAKQKESRSLFQVLRRLEKISKSLDYYLEKQNLPGGLTSTADQVSQKLLFEKLDQLHQDLNKVPDKQLNETWFDVEETMKILNISRRTLQIYRDDGILSFSQVGSKIYFRAEDLQEHLKKHYVKAFKTRR